MNLNATWTCKLGRWLVILSLALLTHASWAQEERVVAFAGAQMRFVSLPQARKALSAEDIWLATTSDFQRAATMGVAPPVTPQQFREHLASAAVAWTTPQQERWLKAIAVLAPRFEALRVPLPSQVILVQTNGTDAANSPYTRANAIFLPTTLSMHHSDAEILAHELFHVVTRHDPALAGRLYAELGFESAELLDWPREWLGARISNPDAPLSRHFMRIEMGGRLVAVMPLLVARRTRLSAGETFFDVLDVRLLVVEPGTDGQPTRAARQYGGQLIWQPADRTPQFLARLGGNTNYVFHPEETAADNFAFLVTGRDVPNKDLLRRMERVLLALK